MVHVTKFGLSTFHVVSEWPYTYLLVWTSHEWNLTFQYQISWVKRRIKCTKKFDISRLPKGGGAFTKYVVNGVKIAPYNNKDISSQMSVRGR